jgi:hypothetical protein
MREQGCSTFLADEEGRILDRLAGLEKIITREAIPPGRGYPGALQFVRGATAVGSGKRNDPNTCLASKQIGIFVCES